MKNRKLVALMLLVAALVLVAAGCGSKKNGYSASKADFAAGMNSICAAVNAKIKAIGAITSLSDLATKGPDVLKDGQDGIAKVKKLGTPPDEIKTAVDDWIAKSDASATLIQKVIDAAKANDSATAAKLDQELTPLNTATDADAKTIGAPACGSQST